MHRARRTEGGTIGDLCLIVEVVSVISMGRPKSDTRNIDQFLFEDSTRVPKTKSTARTRTEIIYHSRYTCCNNHRLGNSVIGTAGLELVLLRSRNSLLSRIELPRGPQLRGRPACTARQRGRVVQLGITKCSRQRTRNIPTSAQEEWVRATRRTTRRRRRVRTAGFICSRREHARGATLGEAAPQCRGRSRCTCACST